MTGKLVKIQPLTESRNGDVTYTRLHFELSDGGFAMTDVVPKFRNYRYWKPVIEKGVGTVITNFHLKGPQKIDADSRVQIV